MINVGKRLIARGPASCPPTPTHLHTETVALGGRGGYRQDEEKGRIWSDGKEEGAGTGELGSKRI